MNNGDTVDAMGVSHVHCDADRISCGQHQKTRISHCLFMKNWRKNLHGLVIGFVSVQWNVSH